MNCDLWFPTPIWHTILEVNNKKIYDFCKKMQLEDNGRNRSNQGGWQSHDILPADHTELFELSQEIFKYTATALDCFKYDTKNKQLYFYNLWININSDRYSYNKTHTHPGTLMSGVYYLKCNNNSGKICFPRNDTEDYIIQSGGDIKEYNQFNYSIAGYTPEVSKLIIFPAWIPHYVEPNEDDSERISLAFNIGLR